MVSETVEFLVGAGPFGAISIGSFAARFTLVARQVAFAVARSGIVRFVIGLLFALPAARALATMYPLGMVARGHRCHHHRWYRLGTLDDRRETRSGERCWVGPSPIAHGVAAASR